MNTTRMHPRTLNEAFRHTADYGCAVERTRPADRAVMWACAAGVAGLAFGLMKAGLV